MAINRLLIKENYLIEKAVLEGSSSVSGPTALHPTTAPHGSSPLKPQGQPGAKNEGSSSLPFHSSCELDGRKQSHPAEGYLINSEGTKLSKLCLPCAKKVLSEYRQKLSKEEREQLKLEGWTFERFEKEKETEEESTDSAVGVPILTSEVHIFSLDASTQSLLLSLISSHKAISSKISSLTDEQRGIKESIEEICLEIPSKRIIFPDGLSTTRTSKSSTSFNKSKAISECVNRSIDPIDFLDILTLSTEKKKGKEYVMINDPEKKGKGEEKPK